MYFSIMSVGFIYSKPDTRIFLTMTKTIYRRDYSGLWFVLVVVVVAVVVNLTQTRVIWEDETSFKNMPPSNYF